VPRLSDDFLLKWEKLIEGVDKKDIPIECIKRVVIRLTDGRRRYFNMSILAKKGLDVHQLESALNNKLQQYDGEIQDVDFFVDVEKVAELIQPSTDEILSKLE
jgi:hypothetical protein|tara:strand:+ start:1866 stop:2174 length:309 start_codon:yes stop_codon:yes gene_type:complete